MEDGELEFSNHEMLPSSQFCEFPEISSMDSFFDDIFKDAHACTHAHTCNPPGPDNSHTHTCYHVHTKIVPPSCEDKSPSDDTAESAENNGKRRPLSNKEAVRKYREKKKARAASLEDEVVRLRAMNQQLLKRLQGQAVLEAEIARLKCLLVDIRGRIEGEIGSFPYQKPMNSAYAMNPCNIQCDDQVYCHYPGSEGNGRALNGQGFNSCGFENVQCLSNGLNEVPGCALGNDTPTAEASRGSKRKGGRRAAKSS